MGGEYNEILRAVIISQLLIFSLSLFLRKKKFLSHQMLGIHFLVVAITHLLPLLYIPFDINLPPVIQKHRHAGFNPFSYLWAPTLYLYVKSVVFSNFRLRKQDTYHIIPFILASTMVCILIWYPDTGIFRDGTADFLPRDSGFNWITYLCLALYSLVYYLLTLKVLVSFNRQIKETSLQISLQKIDWLNFLVLGYIFWYLLSIVINVNFILSNDIKFNWAPLLLSIFFYNIIFVKGWHQPEIFAGIEAKYHSWTLPKEDADKLTVMIKTFLTTQKPYLNPGLTIRQLAQSLNISTHLLSRILNEYFHKNFSDYINSLRIEEAKKILQDPANKKTILEILYKTGFNSKATFNTYFKKETGFTPSEFKEACKTNKIKE